MKTSIITSTCFTDSDIRLDAKFHLSDGVGAKKLLDKSPLELFTLSHVTEKIFYGGRSKRNYVKNRDRGISFLGSADMLRYDFRGLKTISSKHTINLESYALGRNWTLVSRSGTIGNTVFTNKDFLDKAASEHIIRIVPNKKIRPGVLYAYLSSKYGYALMTQVLSVGLSSILNRIFSLKFQYQILMIGLRLL